MKLSEKTILGVYLQTTIVVLGLALFLQMRGKTQEGFEELATLLPSLGYNPSTPIKCVGSDGTSQCRFMDSTPTDLSYIVREISNFVPTYACPKTVEKAPTEPKDRIFNLNGLTCDAPAGSSDIPAAPIDPLQIKCGFGEIYHGGVRKCTKVAGTIEKCISPTSTDTSDDVKKAMLCYAARYPELAEKYRNDTKLLYDDYMNIGRYLVRNPCCEGDTVPTPSGYINLFGYDIKKDWKFWTGFSTVMLCIVFIVAKIVFG